MTLILASQSTARKAMLESAQVAFETAPAGIDEDALTAALLAENAPPRDIADALAEAKARKVALRYPGAMVLGSDQIVALDNGELMTKAQTPGEAKTHLQRLSGQRHHLISAAVIVEDGSAVWRAVEEVKMLMRPLSDGFIDDYVGQYWQHIRQCAGGYRIEAEGAQLFNRIEGSHFAVLGMPLLPLLGYLRIRGEIAS